MFSVSLNKTYLSFIHLLPLSRLTAEKIKCVMAKIQACGDDITGVNDLKGKIAIIRNLFPAQCPAISFPEDLEPCVVKCHINSVPLCMGSSDPCQLDS